MIILVDIERWLIESIGGSVGGGGGGTLSAMESVNCGEFWEFVSNFQIMAGKLAGEDDRKKKKYTWLIIGACRHQIEAILSFNYSSDTIRETNTFGDFGDFINWEMKKLQR